VAIASLFKALPRFCRSICNVSCAGCAIAADAGDAIAIANPAAPSMSRNPRVDVVMML
jgi:hypothetical protein